MITQSNYTYNYIRRFRKERGLSQKDTTRILGLKSSGMVSRWEKGVSLPGTLNALKLAALYRTTVDNLFWEIRLSMVDEVSKMEEAVMGNGRDKDV